MNYLLILSTFIVCPLIFGQNETLWIENEGVISQGVIGFESAPELFVGQEYSFTIISNHSNFDLEITSSNMKVTLLPESKKGTGGLSFKVTPIKKGVCTIQLSVGNDEKRVASLISRTFHAVEYPTPSIFISGIRSGGSISELSASAKIVCKYDSSLGIFESYPIKSWKATLGGKEFSGQGDLISEQLVEAVNQAKENEVLILTVELEKNQTGHRTSESVFILK